MNAASDVSMRAIPDIQTSFHPLKAFALLGALALGAAFCVASYGLDVSVGFF